MSRRSRAVSAALLIFGMWVLARWSWGPTSHLRDLLGGEAAFFVGFFSIPLYDLWKKRKNQNKGAK